MTRKIRIKVFSVSRILSSVSWQFLFADKSKIACSLSYGRFLFFPQSILALALNGGGRQGIFLCPYHLPFYVVKYKYVIIFSMEWL